MALIYITGPTASGKTTVGEALKNRGYEVYDTDDEGMRRWRNAKNKQWVNPPIKDATEDPHWHAQHNFALLKEPIEKLYKKAESKTIFLVGITANDLELKDLFSKTILLSIDRVTQAHRIKTRTNHDYGKLPHQFEKAQKWRQPQIEKYRDAGAIEIDAAQPMNNAVQ